MNQSETPIEKPKISIGTYIQNVKEAFGRGQIHFGKSDYRFYGATDRDYTIKTPSKNLFSHLPKDGEPGYLQGSNTRVLSDMAELVYKFLLRNISRERKVNVLSLGSGSGTEPSDISHIAGDYNRPVEIHTVALTPLDPTLRLIIPNNVREKRKKRKE